MAAKGVEEKPSQTALFGAMRRYIAHREYPNSRFGSDDLAARFLPPSFQFLLRFEKVRLNVKERLNGAFPGMHEYIIARTAYFDRLFTAALNEQTPQIVLLGAGYDSRAYRFASLNQGTRIFELDAAPTQARKKKCLKRAKITIPSQVTFVPIDFNLDSLKEVLEAAGWQASQKTLFIWEGVTYYLHPQSVDATLDFVSRSAHLQSTIAFDLTITITLENQNIYYGVKEFLAAMQAAHANEALTFAIDEGTIWSFLEQRNLKLIEYLDNVEIERTFLKGEDGKPIGRIIGHFRFVSAAPKGQ